MSKLTTRGRKKVASKNFVFPRGTKASKGEPKFPIHDKAHARSALSRAGQKRTKLTRKERCKVVTAVCKKFPTMGLCETGKMSPKSALKRAGCAELAWVSGRKKKAPAKKAPAKRAAKKSDVITGRWKVDPRGGVSRTIRTKGDVTEQWMPFGKPDKRKSHLFVAKHRDGQNVVLYAYDAADARKRFAADNGQYDYDLKTVRRATPAEVKRQSEGYWD